MKLELLFDGSLLPVDNTFLEHSKDNTCQPKQEASPDIKMHLNSFKFGGIDMR